MSLIAGSSNSVYQQYGAASSFLTVYNQAGQNITAYIGTSGSNGVPEPVYQIDTTICVEWSHAIAPGAKIDLIETNDDSMTNKLIGVATGANFPGVSVLLDDDGNDESSNEASSDNTFVTPAGHIGVTFLGCAGDAGAPSLPIYPGHPVPPGLTERDRRRRDAIDRKRQWRVWRGDPAGVTTPPRTTTALPIARPARGPRRRAASAGPISRPRAGARPRRVGRQSSLLRTKERPAARSCPRPGRPAPATRPMRPTRRSSTTVRSPQGMCSGPLWSIRPRPPSGLPTAILSSRSWAITSPTSGTLEPSCSMRITRTAPSSRTTWASPRSGPVSAARACTSPSPPTSAPSRTPASA